MVELALSLEAALKSSRALKNTDSLPSVYKLTLHKPHSSRQVDVQREKPFCRRGNANHTPSACSFCEAKCRFCGKVGHIARVCKSKARLATAEAQPRSSKQSTTAWKTNWLQRGSSAHMPTDSQVEVHCNLAAGSRQAYRCSLLSSSLGGELTVSHHGDRYWSSCEPDLQRAEGQVVLVGTADTVKSTDLHLHV